MQEKNESVEESYEDRVFKVAEKVCARKKRGIPVDRWASTEEMKLFVEDMFENAVQRNNSIIKDITTDKKPVSKSTERDVLPLLTRSDLDQEINLLGIQAQEDASTPDLLKIQKDRLQRLKLLSKINKGTFPLLKT